MVERYRRRISGPLLDRIDLRIDLAPPDIEDLLNSGRQIGPAPGVSDAELRAAVSTGLERVRDRQGSVRNTDLASEDLDRWAPLDAESRRLLEAAAKSRAFSARALQALRRVARSVADLEDRGEVSSEHLAQALALRGALI